VAAGDSARAEAERVRKKIETLQRYLDAQERGALGERRTAEALEGLGDAWVQFHDLRWPGRRLANVDHVVVGPGGIFVIDSKNWSGALTMRDGVLRQNGYSREPAVAGVSDAALAVAELAGPYAGHVHPVLCFTGRPDFRGMVREVLVCSDDTVVELLTTREPVFSPEHVLDVATRLDAQMRPATERAGGPTKSRSRSSRRPVGGASPRPRPPRQRKRHSVRRGLMKLLVVGAFFFVGLPILSSAGPAFGDWFAHLNAPAEKCRSAQAEPHVAKAKANANAPGKKGEAPTRKARAGAACVP
jgi:hypothetical protein